MLKKVHLNITLNTQTENGDDHLHTEAEGGCVVEDSGIMLRYIEPDNHGHATLLLTDGLADLKRKGNTSSRMTFIANKLIPCVYETPHGPLDLSIYTHSEHYSVTPEGGIFEVRYTLLAAGRQVADNHLKVALQFLN